MANRTPTPVRLVLASGSPRRHDLLNLIGLSHLVRPTDIDESPQVNESAVQLVLRAAQEKAEAAVASDPGLPVLGADTIVELNGEILGKPASEEAATLMLRSLSGATHQVHTAVALIVDGRCESLVDTATVRFLELSPESIDWYIATGEPMDKAGAYAIQGAGGLLIAGIEGSPNTVIGLPTHRLHELYQRHGLSLWNEILIR
jgi:septum formation protein